MESVKFNYLYRDAGNYKKWAEVNFSNPDGLPLPDVVTAFKDAFLPDGLFVADQVRLPEAFFSTRGNANSDDHCFHEFDGIDISLEAPNDRHGRSISQFIKEVKKEADRGWMTFDPHDTPRAR